MRVGVRELKARLSAYLRMVQAGQEIIITHRGKPIGRIVPMAPTSPEDRIRELMAMGVVSWSGRKPSPPAPVARARGEVTVADLLLEDRD